MLQKQKVLKYAICAVLLIGLIVSVVMLLHQRGVLRGRAVGMDLAQKLEIAEERRIASAYVQLNYAFLIALDPCRWGEEAAYDHASRYIDLHEQRPKNETFGVNVTIYVLLLMYYHRTGITLEYEAVFDYFSHEFEPDGSLRLYDNGNHPEIEAFVRWMWDGRRRQELNEYWDNLNAIFMQYVIRHRDDGFVSPDGFFLALSPQMLRALARTEADPDYVLDLTSLQQQGH